MKNYNVNIKEMEKIYNHINIHPTEKDPFFIGGTTFWVSNAVMKKYFTNTLNYFKLYVDFYTLIDFF